MAPPHSCCYWPHGQGAPKGKAAQTAGSVVGHGGVERQTARLSSLPKSLTSPLPRTGTILVREWRGTTYQVTVVDDGFLWNGKTHRSLSSIARAITGTNWNGSRFFGMREAKNPAPETHRGS
jgi:hypothetical protein